MQLKPGTMGVIVKSKSCCNDSSQIGKIVSYVRKAPYGVFTCRSCLKDVLGDLLIEINISIGLDLVEYNSVKWFNDDIDLEDTTEEVAKELENATK